MWHPMVGMNPYYAGQHFGAPHMVGPLPEYIPFNRVLHHKQSSVRVNCCGMLSEVRRGLYQEEELIQPIVWNNMDEWMEFIGMSPREFFLPDRPLEPEWNADQQLVADYTRISTLRLNTVLPQYLTAAKTNYEYALTQFHADPYNYWKYVHACFFYERLMEVHRDLSWGEYKTTGTSTVYVLDQCGTLRPIYINLKTGVMKSTHHTCGSSFAELGIIPVSVWAMALKDMIRID
jgi:hypothetical protein